MPPDAASPLLPIFTLAAGVFLIASDRELGLNGIYNIFK
jgi:hypothetical protein